MKLRYLKDVLYSVRGEVQWAIVYDYSNNVDLTPECSIEYAIENFGDRFVHRISASNNLIIISVI